MSTPLFYRVVRAVARMGSGVYFRKLELTGKVNVPTRGPVILASNHPQSITDALILALAAGRTVHYVAHSGLFKNPLKAAFLRHCCVIPIHRPKDVASSASKNIESFRACRELLERGGCIGIFPEGTSQDERRVQRIKTGTARIALESESVGGFELGVVIVPVGLSFQSRQRFRSRILVSFGEPIVVADYQKMYAKDSELAASYITDLLEQQIRRRVVDVRQSELEDLVVEVERIYRAELQEREDIAITHSSWFESEQAFSREIARASEYFHETDPDFLRELAEKIHGYRRKLKRLHLRDRIVRERGMSFRGEAARFTLGGILGLPLALHGAILNFLPFRLTNVLARRIAADATKIHGMQIGLGGILFPPYYAALIWFVSTRFGLWSTIGFAVSLPLSGIFARWYIRVMNRRRLYLRFTYLQATHGRMIHKLRRERREIIDTMDEAMKRYLVETGRGGGEYPWEAPNQT